MLGMAVLWGGISVSQGYFGVEVTASSIHPRHNHLMAKNEAKFLYCRMLRRYPKDCQATSACPSGKSGVKINLLKPSAFFTHHQV